MEATARNRKFATNLTTIHFNTDLCTFCFYIQVSESGFLGFCYLVLEFRVPLESIECVPVVVKWDVPYYFAPPLNEDQDCTRSQKGKKSKVIKTQFLC